MRKVLLLNPPSVNGVRYTREGRCQERESVLGTVKPPLTLALLAALLRNRGIEFHLIDATIESLTTRNIIDRLRGNGFTPEVVVFATSTPTVYSDMAVARTLKDTFKSLLVAFGPHTSGIPKETLAEFPWLDVAIVGEPENPVLSLCEAERLTDVEATPGICLRSNHCYKPPAPARVTDLAQLPYPAWDLLPRGAYRLPLVDEPYLLVETSRGCPPACDFCVVTLTHGRNFRERNAIQVVDEIQEGIVRFGVRCFYLWADTVTLGRKFLVEFCAEIQRRNLSIRWLGNTRIDTLTNKDMVRNMKQSGCWMLSVGIETADDEIRSSMSKRFSRERVREVQRWLREEGIVSVGFFILGYLGDSLQTMRATIDFATEVDPDFAAFYPAVPYPGTPFFEECERRGWIVSRDWTRYDYSDYVISNHVLTRENVLKLQKDAYRRFYLQPRVVVRSLRYMNSLVAVRQAAKLLWSRMGL